MLVSSFPPGFPVLILPVWPSPNTTTITSSVRSCGRDVHVCILRHRALATHTCFHKPCYVKGQVSDPCQGCSLRETCFQSHHRGRNTAVGLTVPILSEWSKPAEKPRGGLITVCKNLQPKWKICQWMLLTDRVTVKCQGWKMQIGKFSLEISHTFSTARKISN